MTFKQAVKHFVDYNEPFSDYWSMQQEWGFYVDTLCREGTITIKQSNKWTNPCTPETFKRFNKKLYKGDFE